MLLGYSISRLVIASVDYESKEAHVLIQEIKLLINHAMILSLINDIGFAWDEKVKVVMEIENYSYLWFFSNLIQFKCVLMGDQGNSTVEQTPNFFQHLVFTAFYPFILLLVFTILSYIFSISKGMAYIKNSIASFNLINLWLLYPDVTRQIFNTLSCADIVDGDKVDSRLFFDTEVKCWEGQHLNMIRFICIPGLFFWVIGLPGIFYMKMCTHHDYMKDTTLLSTESFDRRKKIQKTLKRLGFLFIGLKPDYYYWEILVMVRKAALIFMAVSFETYSPVGQCLVSLFIIFADMYFLYKYQPYESKQMNNL